LRIIQSIRTKLIIGFMAVLLPVIVYMLITNNYSRDLVRDKVSETYRNTLDIFVGQIDVYLEQINNYMYKMAVLDSDVGLLMSFPMDSDGYTLTKVRIDSKLNRDVGVYSLIDAVFVYHENDTIFGTESMHNDLKKVITSQMDKLAAEHPMQINEQYGWKVQADERVEGGYFLINFIKVSGDMYVGATVKVKDIHDMLKKQWSDGDIGYSDIYLNDGEVELALTESAVVVDAAAGQSVEQGIETITNLDQDYLVMNQMSEKVNIAYKVLIPEKTLLRNLLFFRNATLIAPVAFLVILLIYLVFMQNMLFKPLHELILGMKKISMGMLDVRLKRKESIEFEFLANTFNVMAEQIKTLKIDVYEEQLRVKQGELKQLQAQINPHFYMNSLNIIYNLAVLKDTESVKKMSLHLADYFRFIMRVNRDTITLKEELKHIENYIIIQQLRFPDRLECVFEGVEPLLHYPIAALTVQPFVENAIIHGFKNRRRMFHINIIAHINADQSFQLTIKDNGVGFKEEVLDKLRRREELKHEDESTSLGILNVIHRLDLLYGSKATISFNNNEDGFGASVQIRFPAIEEGVKDVV